jgi:DNA polymerase-3 subunit delta
MFYVLHGDEEFMRSEQVLKLKERVMEDGLGGLNVTELDGRKLSLRELQDVCNTLPFLSQRRLVIVADLLLRFAPRSRSRRKEAAAVSDSDQAFADALLAYLPNLPPTTRLVFVESQTLPKNHPVLALAAKLEDGYVQSFDLPDAARLARWVVHRAQEKGAEITRPAAALLVANVGPKLRQLDQELAKLAGWTNWQRPIEEDDVRQLVGTSYESNIFELVDALGMRQGQRAIRQLQRLVEDGANELYLLTMVARQVRLILAVKELAEEERLGADEIRRRLHISHSFIVDKLQRQARFFTLGELEQLLARLLEIDQAIKTGKMEGLLALELLLVEICGQGASR